MHNNDVDQKAIFNSVREYDIYQKSFKLVFSFFFSII